MFNNRVKVAIVIYLLIVSIIYGQKPKSMFHEDGTCIDFGVLKNQTLFSFPLCVCVVSIFVYYVLGLICINYSTCS